MAKHQYSGILIASYLALGLVLGVAIALVAVVLLGYP